MKNFGFVVAVYISVAFSMCYSSLSVADDVADVTKTPGAVRKELTKAEICSIKWGSDHRHVTEAMKTEAFARYGYSGYDDARCIPDGSGKKTCEIDHLISRELGGADIIENLWPQAYGTSPWNAHRKDMLENRLNKEMCAGRILMTEKESKAIRVGCGRYDWAFQREPELHVNELIITIEAMLILDAAMTIEVMRWVGQLDYPWTSAAAVTRTLALGELQPVRRYVGRENRLK